MSASKKEIDDLAGWLDQQVPGLGIVLSWESMEKVCKVILDRQERRERELLDGLGFYSDFKNYEKPKEPGKKAGFSEVEKDCGELARLILVRLDGKGKVKG